ncbi:N-acetyltransferase [Rhizobiaceae bacterium]|nr:N-acetyltransferase [Rhizobiaceae bacterium]
MTQYKLSLRPEGPQDAATVDAICFAAFGPATHVKAAAALREGNVSRADLAFVAEIDGEIVGTVRQWPVRSGTARFLMLGPLAVAPAFEGRGVGRALLNRSVEAARQAGDSGIVLVGARQYYAASGFMPMSGETPKLPRPVDPARLLLLPFDPGLRARMTGAIVADAPR